MPYVDESRIRGLKATIRVLPATAADKTLAEMKAADQFFTLLGEGLTMTREESDANVMDSHGNTHTWNTTAKVQITATIVDDKSPEFVAITTGLTEGDVTTTATEKTVPLFQAGKKPRWAVLAYGDWGGGVLTGVLLQNCEIKAGSLPQIKEDSTGTQIEIVGYGKGAEGNPGIWFDEITA